MYYLYVEKQNAYSPDLIGEYSDLEDAQDKADELKKEDSTIRYYIERTNGAFNSYGELLTDIIERG